ncbi:MAG: hypothetical protein ABWZ25_11430 [Chitinophagaceae bacterium]
MKKLNFSMIAAILAVALSSFGYGDDTRTRDANGQFTEFWYELVSGGNPTQPQDYILLNDEDGDPPICVHPEVYRCAILTEKQGGATNPNYPNLATYSVELERKTP